MKGSVANVQHGENTIAVTILLATCIEVTIGTGNTGGAVPLGDENSTTPGRIRKAVQDTGLLGLCKCRQAQEGTRHYQNTFHRSR